MDAFVAAVVQQPHTYGTSKNTQVDSATLSREACLLEVATSLEGRDISREACLLEVPTTRLCVNALSYDSMQTTCQKTLCIRLVVGLNANILSEPLCSREHAVAGSLRGRHNETKKFIRLSAYQLMLAYRDYGTVESIWSL